MMRKALMMIMMCGSMGRIILDPVEWFNMVQIEPCWAC